MALILIVGHCSYGDRGRQVILFGLRTIYPHLTNRNFVDGEFAGRSSTDVFQAVLVPEAALELIMEDRNLDSASAADRAKALSILRASYDYGNLKYPVDEDEMDDPETLIGELNHQLLTRMFQLKAKAAESAPSPSDVVDVDALDDPFDGVDFDATDDLSAEAVARGWVEILDRLVYTDGRDRDYLTNELERQIGPAARAGVWQRAIKYIMQIPSDDTMDGPYAHVEKMAADDKRARRKRAAQQAKDRPSRAAPSRERKQPKVVAASPAQPAPAPPSSQPSSSAPPPASPPQRPLSPQAADPAAPTPKLVSPAAAASASSPSPPNAESDAMVIDARPDVPPEQEAAAWEFLVEAFLYSEMPIELATTKLEQWLGPAARTGVWQEALQAAQSLPSDILVEADERLQAVRDRYESKRASDLIVAPPSPVQSPAVRDVLSPAQARALPEDDAMDIVARAPSPAVSAAAASVPPPPAPLAEPPENNTMEVVARPPSPVVPAATSSVRPPPLHPAVPAPTASRIASSRPADGGAPSDPRLRPTPVQRAAVSVPSAERQLVQRQPTVVAPVPPTRPAVTSPTLPIPLTLRRAPIPQPQLPQPLPVVTVPATEPTRPRQAKLELAVELHFFAMWPNMRSPQFIVRSNRDLIPPVPQGSRHLRLDGRFGLHEASRLPQMFDATRPWMGFIPLPEPPEHYRELKNKHSWWYREYTDLNDARTDGYGFGWLRWNTAYAVAATLDRRGEALLVRLREDLRHRVRSAIEKLHFAFHDIYRKYDFVEDDIKRMQRGVMYQLERRCSYMMGNALLPHELQFVFVAFQRWLLEAYGLLAFIPFSESWRGARFDMSRNLPTAARGVFTSDRREALRHVAAGVPVWLLLTPTEELWELCHSAKLSGSLRRAINHTYGEGGRRTPQHLAKLEDFERVLAAWEWSHYATLPPLQQIQEMPKDADGDGDDDGGKGKGKAKETPRQQLALAAPHARPAAQDKEHAPEWDELRASSPMDVDIPGPSHAGREVVVQRAPQQAPVPSGKKGGAEGEQIYLTKQQH